MTVSQPMRALAKANAVRLGQSALKAEVRAGLPFVDALEDPRAARMRVGDLLTELPGWAARRMSATLAELRISEHRRVAELTLRQAHALVAVVSPGQRLKRRPDGQNEPQREDARVIAALLKGPATRAELALRLREMALEVVDLDAALTRLRARLAVVVESAAGYDLFTVNSTSEEAA